MNKTKTHVSSIIFRLLASFTADSSSALSAPFACCNRSKLSRRASTGEAIWRYRPKTRHQRERKNEWNEHVVLSASTSTCSHLAQTCFMTSGGFLDLSRAIHFCFIAWEKPIFPISPNWDCKTSDRKHTSRSKDRTNEERKSRRTEPHTSSTVFSIPAAGIAE